VVSGAHRAFRVAVHVTLPMTSPVAVYLTSGCVDLTSSNSDFCTVTVSSVTSTRRRMTRKAESCSKDSIVWPLSVFMIRLRSCAQHTAGNAGHVRLDAGGGHGWKGDENEHKGQS